MRRIALANTASKGLLTQKNRLRDHTVNRELRRAGWRVLRIWEHQLSKANEARVLRRLRQAWAGGSKAVVNRLIIEMK